MQQKIINFSDLPPCILQYISDNFLDFQDIIHLKQANKKCTKIKIKDFYNIPINIKCKLTNKILKQHIYIEKLDASFGHTITLHLNI